MEQIAKNPKILIIGAGASGIAAASKLYENGFTDITILEAENRIGGRINSVEFEGSIVDLGGQWVHGEVGNLVYDMVKDLDLLSPSFNTYEDMTFYSSDGTVLEKTITDRLFQMAKEVLDDEENALHETGTFGNYFIKKYNEAVLMNFGTSKEILKLANQIQEWFNKFFLCLDSAKSWHDISVRGAFAFKACAGNQQLNWRNKGYKTILDVLMKKIPDPSRYIPIEEKIVLNKTVSSIQWDDKVTVTCIDGSSYIADHVLITTSTGVLKENHKAWFKPQLPPYKINSIEHVALGTVNKILLKFPIKWWPDDVKGFSFVWTEEGKFNLRNEVADVEPTINGKSWLENVFGFYVIDSHPQVLLGWVIGELAAEVEKLSDEVVISNCWYLLKKFIGDKHNIPEPDAVLRSKWHSNPHFRGSYTFCSVEAEENQASADDLARPVCSNNGNEVLLFAGESTHKTHYSTVHGAIETGYREAERLINIYKQQQHTKVIIVGAGMAGLGAASVFSNRNFNDFLLIEASERIGGRVHTVYIDGGQLDLGAQWIHGKNNPLYEIASSNGLLSQVQTFEGGGLFVRNDGLVFDDFLVKKIDWVVGEILEKCRTFINAYPKSVKSFLDHEFREYLKLVDEEEIEFVRQLYDWHIRFQIIDNSCTNLDTVSAKYWSNYVCTDENPCYSLKHGFQSLTDIILKGIQKERFLLNTPVSTIISNGDLIEIHTTNNEIFTCNHVIVTPSLGVLKNSKQFGLKLPEHMEQSISNMGFFGIGKIFLVFGTEWWGKIEGFQLLWSSEHILEQPEEWFRSLTGFQRVSTHPTVLMGMIGGVGVATMETLNEEEIGRVCIKYLREFLPKFNVPDPKQVIKTTWLSNDCIMGSYSHVSSKCDQIDFSLDDLIRPVGIEGAPRILLAGEAVHPSHYSTAHGAFETGQKQSRIIYDYITRTENI